MRIAIHCAVCMFILTVSARGQEVGSVDLTRPPVGDEFERGLSGPFLPNGCVKRGGGLGDGAVFATKNQAHEISVEVMKLGSEDHTTGGTERAEVKLLNSGNYPINIPWNTDLNSLRRTQDSRNFEWEVGSFHILLDRDDLKNSGQPIYGSTFSKGSMLTIQPSEWIKALITFKLELEHPWPGHFVKSGARQLQVKWEQSRLTQDLDLKKCEQWSGWLTYRNFYKQQNPPFTMSIARNRSVVR
jgi:hypothetical protein